MDNQLVDLSVMPVRKVLYRVITSPFFIPALTSLFLAITIMLSAAAINSVEQATRSQARDALQAVLQTTVTTYHTWIDYRLRDVDELANNPTLLNLAQQLINAEPANKARVQQQLRQFLSPKLNKENDQGFFIITPDHISLASLRDSNLNTVNVIHRHRPEYLSRVLSGETLFIPTLHSDVAINAIGTSQIDNWLTIFVAAPLSVNNTIIGALAIRLSLHAFFNDVTNISQLGDTGETYAFDKNGIMITHSRFEQQLQRSGLVSPSNKGVMNIRITDPGGNVLKGYKPTLPREQQPLTVMAASATQGESSFNTRGYRDYRGSTVFGVWLWDQSLGFGITTEIDADEALHPFHQTRRSILGLLSLILIMAITLIITIIKIQHSNKRALKTANETLEQRVKERTKELDIATQALINANVDLEVLATTDGLTGLANRRTFDTHIHNEWLHCRREKNTLGVIIFDVDYFKKFNDNYGHPEGDKCLKRIAKCLQHIHSIKRPGDLVARYGGEEFVMVLSNPSASYIQATVARVINQIQALQIPHAYTEIDTKVVTLSAGYVIENRLNNNTVTELIERADSALYKAKSLGRNRACAYEEPIEPSNEPNKSVIQGIFREP